MGKMWEPWTGCYPTSVGCKYCYIYGQHAKRHGQNTVVRTDEFYKPLETVYMPRKKVTKYKIDSSDKTVGVCFASDFFIKEADEWRREAWNIIRQRPDLTFTFLTKRIDRFFVSLPDDWDDGYDNVEIGCGVENQATADVRLPLFLSYPIKKRKIVCAPLLGEVDLSAYLQKVNSVVAGGESGRDARECNYDWVLDIRQQCIAAGVPFQFRGTGSNFRQDGILRQINPKLQRRTAREMNIDTVAELEETDLL
jgi:protein gp37